jgi:hypothetical protein
MIDQFPNTRQTHTVSSFSALVSTEFYADVNAICWKRALLGNYQEIVEKIELEDQITEISPEDLMALELSAAGEVARLQILNDIHVLTEYGASPVLNLIKNYSRDDEFDFISTDVYSYHVDRSPIATDTFLCTYYGAASDILPNAQAIQKILIPEIRTQLKALHDGTDADFENFLQEYYFDLHYAAQSYAQPQNLGQGHLWKLAVDHPEQKVLPCVHRAPYEAGQYRLLLIC